MSKHTPGPWDVVLTGTRGSFHIPQAATHEAENWDDGVDGYTVSKANANLIKAAPDFLKAGKRIMEMFDFHYRDGYLPVNETHAPLIDLLAAIAKAEEK